MKPQDSASKADQRVKFLGLAFAGADVAFEVDEAGIIRFAVGAVEQITGIREADFVGQSWTELVSESDAATLDALLHNLGPGERQGPTRVALKSRRKTSLTRYASLSVFRLPQNGEGLSCALSMGAPAVQGEFPRDAVGLLDAKSFDDAAAATLTEAARAGQPVTLALVQLPGLDSALAGLNEAEAAAARRKINATLKLESYGGVGASEIAPDRYAFVRSTATPAKRVTERLKSVCGPSVTPHSADLALDGASPAQSLKAVRYALSQFIEADPKDISVSFKAMLERTTRETARFKTSLAAQSFSLVYQPVIDLARETPHHFEALARFPGAESTAAAIELAEETGMIIDLDLAVAQSVFNVLATEEKIWKVAFNLSALSLMTPRCLDAFAALTAKKPELRQRLLIEVTETRKLHDLQAANNVIARLRKIGHQVCLDDFGAGSANLDYLSRLEVDFVKIDGRYIRNLQTQPRDLIVVKHVAALCRDLGVKVIAEMVETEATAAAMRELGVPLGQGWLYGKPTDKPIWPPAAASSAPVRRGAVVEQWG